MARHSRQSYRSAPRPVKPVDRSESNSPASNVCYASEFPAYVTGEGYKDPVANRASFTAPVAADVSVAPADTNSSFANHDIPPLSTSAAVEDVSKVDVPATVAYTAAPASNEPEGTVPAAEANVGLLSCTSLEDPKPEPTKSPTPSVRKQIKSPRLSTPVPATKAESEEVALPRVLSFQEIMERKRRKQAAAAATTQSTFKGTPNGTSAESVDATPMGTPYKSPMGTPREHAQTEASVGDKRRTAGDDEGMASDVSEGKRARQRTPQRSAIKNYVALFEQELEDLSAGLSGPLENTPSSDKISHAIITGDDIDTDIGQMLEQ
ncbi:hypothetical protein H4R20_005219 [Coemansia guatemalensis]|uniref:Uncharacterized protein n=1 Tax=Coemansia guatemalensis TaxID=2761395 RepID=A0A9W8HQ82_9FUNG|nr:hypothetical protein H4R20_005219 [Coemansia guatemalensis]